MAICPRCGASVREDKAFCFNCGAQMNAARAEAEELTPEFSKTIIAPPQTRSAEPAAPSRFEAHPVAPAEMAQARDSNSALAGATARRGFFGRRAWIVVTLLLLVLVLCFIAWAVLSD